jgi:hypothetical protein
MQQEPQAFEKYPGWAVFVHWLIFLIVYFASTYIISQFSRFWAGVYILYIILLEIWTYKEGCSICYYYNKRCFSGRGKIAPLFFKKGDPQKFCQKKVTVWNLLPHALVTLLPIIIGVILLIKDFNWLILVLAVIPVLNWFVGNQIVFGKIACPHCSQVRICCPAQDFFGKRLEKK